MDFFIILLDNDNT